MTPPGSGMVAYAAPPKASTTATTATTIAGEGRGHRNPCIVVSFRRPEEASCQLGWTLRFPAHADDGPHRKSRTMLDRWRTRRAAPALAAAYGYGVSFTAQSETFSLFGLATVAAVGLHASNAMMPALSA